jgi:phosphoglycolate phosphatase
VIHSIKTPSLLRLTLTEYFFEIRCKRKEGILNTMIQQKKLIIFDYDGVIVDSIETNLKVVQLACEKIGHPADLEKMRMDRLENIAFDELARHLGLSGDAVEQFRTIIFDLLAENIFAPKIFVGMPEVILKLAENNYLAIITSNVKSAVIQIIAASGLLDKFDFIAGAEQMNSKSAKIMGAMTEFDIPPGSTYMIGDGLSDIREAHKAGVNSIAVTWGYHSKAKLEKARPAFFVNHPSEILSIFG